MGGVPMALGTQLSDKIRTMQETQVIEKYGAPGGTRTPDLLVRSQTLYPTELRAHSAGPLSLASSSAISTSDLVRLACSGSLLQ